MKKEATPDSEKNTRQYMRDNYIDALIAYMANERLNEMQDASPKPCLSATASLGQFFISKTKDAFNLSFGARQENVKGSFDAAVGVIERIRQHGFTQGELDRAKAVRHKITERSWSERNDRRNNYYVKRAQVNFLDSEPLLSAEESKALSDEFEQSVTLAEVNKAVGEAITDKNQVLVAYMPDKPEFPTFSNQQLEQYVLDAQAKAYEPYKEKAAPTKLMEKTPKPGRIVGEKPSVNGTTEFTLSNGVKVYYRHTNFQADNVITRLWGDGGSSLYPAEDKPNVNMIATAVSKTGVGNLNEDELDKILASKNVRISPAVGQETQSINGSSSIKDAETLFQLTYLYFTQPRRDEKAFANEVDRTRSFLTNRNASPKVGYNDSIAYAVYGNNLRTKPFELSDLDKVSYDRVLQIYKDRFADATGFRMMVIGNISLDSLRPLLETYIASLPAKGRKEKAIDNFPAIVNGMNVHEWTRDTKTPQSSVTVLYSWQEAVNAKNDLTLEVLRRVLSIAYVDSVREEKGGVYGISTEANLDKTGKPTGLLKLSFTTGPDKYKEVMPVVLRQLEDIADNGPLPESLKKVKEYLTKQYGQAAITNDYWSYVIYNHLRYGIDYDKDYLKLVDNLTASDLQRMARRIIDSHRRIIVTMHSTTKKG
jgi:zinc protease